MGRRSPSWRRTSQATTSSSAKIGLREPIHSVSSRWHVKQSVHSHPSIQQPNHLLDTEASLLTCHRDLQTLTANGGLCMMPAPESGTEVRTTTTARHPFLLSGAARPVYFCSALQPFGHGPRSPACPSRRAVTRGIVITRPFTAGECGVQLQSLGDHRA